MFLVRLIGSLFLSLILLVVLIIWAASLAGWLHQRSATALVREAKVNTLGDRTTILQGLSTNSVSGTAHFELQRRSSGSGSRRRSYDDWVFQDFVWTTPATLEMRLTNGEPARVDLQTLDNPRSQTALLSKGEPVKRTRDDIYGVRSSAAVTLLAERDPQGQWHAYDALPVALNVSAEQFVDIAREEERDARTFLVIASVIVAFVMGFFALFWKITSAMAQRKTSAPLYPPPPSGTA